MSRKSEPAGLSSWQLTLLGTPHLRGPQGPLRLEGRAAALFAYLACEDEVPRARLAAWLWPASSDEMGRANLRQLLRRLRVLLGEDLIQDVGGLRLAGDIKVDLRAVRLWMFEERYGDVLDTPGDLLEGFSPDFSPEFEEWLAAEREQLHQWRVHAAGQEARRRERADDLAGALDYALRAVRLDPMSEEAHRAVMRLHYLQGDRGAALGAYARARTLLLGTLGVEPLPETRALAAEIERGGVVPSAPPGRPALPLALHRPPELVGREAQWDLMERAWQGGQIIFLTGEPGTGKSRLALDFAASKGPVLRLDARPGDSNVPYATAVRTTRGLLQGRADLWRPGALAPWVRSELSRLLPELEGGPGPMHSEQERARLYGAVAELYRQVGEPGAVCVVDDVQFADPASQELQFYLLEAARAAPPSPALRFIHVFRKGELPEAGEAAVRALTQSGAAVLIDLPPLGAPAIERWLGALPLPDATPPARFAQQLARYTGGNPLFVVETVKHLFESGLIGQGLPDHLPPPERVHGVLRQRLSRLSRPALHAAHAAAVLQSDFDMELVAQVLSAPLLDVADAWDELEAAQVLVGGRFGHDLVYEAVCADLSPSRRATLHRAAARALSAGSAHPARIAAHWQAGGDPRQAVPWLRRAAAEARRTYRLVEAASFCRGWAEAADGAGDFEAAFEARLEESAVLGDLRDVETRRRVAQTLLSQARTPLQLAEAWHHQSEVAVFVGQAQAAEDAARQGLDSLRRGNMASRRAGELQGTLLVDMGCALWAQERFPEAAEATRQAVALLEPLGDSYGLCTAYGNLGVMLDHLERSGEATEQHRRAAALAERQGFGPPLITALSNLAVSYLLLGQARRSTEVAEQGYLLEQRWGADTPNAVTLLAVLGEASFDLGRYRQAREQFGRALGAAPQNWHAGHLHTLLGEAELALGHPEAAGAHFDAALAWPNMPPQYQSRAHVARALLAWRSGVGDPLGHLEAAEVALAASARPFALARVRLTRGRFTPHAQTVRSAEQTLREAERVGLGGVRVAAQAQLAGALLGCGRTEEAEPHAREALRLSEQFDATVLPHGEALRLVHTVLEAVGAPEAAHARRQADRWFNEVSGLGDPAHLPPPDRAYPEPV